MKTFLSIALAIILLASVQSCSDNGLAGSWLGATNESFDGSTSSTAISEAIVTSPSVSFSSFGTKVSLHNVLSPMKSKTKHRK